MQVFNSFQEMQAGAMVGGRPQSAMSVFNALSQDDVNRGAQLVSEMDNLLRNEVLGMCQQLTQLIADKPTATAAAADVIESVDAAIDSLNVVRRVFS